MSLLAFNPSLVAKPADTLARIRARALRPFERRDRRSEFVAAVRSIDLRQTADVELRRALAQRDASQSLAMAFAATDEAVRRRLGIAPTDEQLLAGRLIFDGKVVEMSAGEGKTVAGAFAAVAHVSAGRTVHVITANDYLADRDDRLLAPVFEALGITSAAVLGHMSDEEERVAYAKQVVYGTVREIGFDFLKDNLRYPGDERVQRSLDVAIVDEADHTLISEAGTPLIISGGRRRSGRSLHKVRRAVDLLVQRQRREVARLEGELASFGGSRDVPALPARLMLASPDRRVLAPLLSTNRRLRRRTLALAYDEAASGSSVADGLDYLIDAGGESATLTERGQALLEAHLGPVFDASELEEEIHAVEEDRSRSPDLKRRVIDTLRRRIHARYGRVNQVYQMLRALVLMERGADYIVTEDQVVLVDRATGRRRPDNRYQHGLQAAVEAKEGVPVQPETEVLASISVPGLMARYAQLSGMTGTAVAARDDLHEAYGLDVADVPLTRPSKRVDLAPRVYETERDKVGAVAEEAGYWQSIGRPVLIGTLTVEQSEELGRALSSHGVDHRVLNAVNSPEEADVVRLAGRAGSVTVATNMAGRGTDILLQLGLDRDITERFVGKATGLLSDDASSLGVSCGSDDEARILREALLRSGIVAGDAEPMSDGTYLVTAGARRIHGNDISLDFGLGLHVIGTELNDSRRVDDQLRGRAARQGEFGSTRLFLSMEDRALAPFARSWSPARSEESRDRAGRHFFEGAPISKMMSEVQQVTEEEERARRGVSLDYTRVVERATLSYYKARREVASAGRMDGLVARSAARRAREIVAAHLPLADIGEYESRFWGLADEVETDYGVECRHLFGLGPDGLGSEIGALIVGAYHRKRLVLEPSLGPDVAQMLLLQTADDMWAGFLAEVDETMHVIWLSSWGHAPAISDFMRECSSRYTRLLERAVDTFVLRFLALEAPAESPPEPLTDEQTRQMEEILV